MDDSPDNYPLVERFHKADHLARELSEHLRQTFLPKLSELRHASKVLDAEEVTDQTMLDRMQAVLGADDFSTSIFEKLIRYLNSIERETKEIMGLQEES